MPKFQIGEEARLKAPLMSLREGKTEIPSGTEVRIIGLPGCCPSHLHPWLIDPLSLYEVEIDGVMKPDGIWVEEQYLEKLTGSWDELEKITGTKFSKTKEKDEILEKVE